MQWNGHIPWSVRTTTEKGGTTNPHSGTFSGIEPCGVSIDQVVKKASDNNRWLWISNVLVTDA